MEKTGPEELTLASSAQSRICLNMIVKNEAHIIHEVLEAVAPYIHYWVIVDTGSDDNTQDTIRAKMRELGIPGQLHERPWRDFGHNRTEALELAQGHGDYIWVMDADDTLVGVPDFTDLTSEGYMMRIDAGVDMWRPQLFRDGVPWRYVGVVHEYPTCDLPFTLERLGGDYHITARQKGGRSLDPRKGERDRDILLAQVERDPGDSRAVFHLAMTCENLGDNAEAYKWFSRRAEMGGFDEEIYFAKFRRAATMDKIGEPWPTVQEAYLEAWEYRPTRAEALYDVALHHRTNGEYELGYLFAMRGAQIPYPESDVLFVHSDIHRWRLLDEQAVCASWIGRHSEALSIVREILRQDGVAEEDRERVLANRAFLVGELLDSCSDYVAEFAHWPSPRRDAEVTVSLAAGPGTRATVEQTLNSFLTCCTDAGRVGRFLVIDAGLASSDRDALSETHPFLDFITSPDADLDAVRQQISSRYWLHLWHGWRFFTEEALLTRLIDVLETEIEVYQIGVNLADASQLSRESPARSGVQATPRGNRYVLSKTTTAGPAMFDTGRLSKVLNPKGVLKVPARTATLDDVFCLHVPSN